MREHDAPGDALGHAAYPGMPSASRVLSRARKIKALELLDFRKHSLWLRGRYVIEALLFLLFGYLKVDSTWGEEPVLTGDGHIWGDVASNPLFTRGFLLPRRPLALPLIWKIIDSDAGLVQLQIVTSTLAWGALAYALSRLVSGFPSLLLFAGTLLLGLGSPAHSWDIVVRAESTAHSFLLLTLACALSFIVELDRAPRRALVYAAMTAHFALWCAFARDSNSYLLILFACAFGVSFWLIARRRGGAASRVSIVGGALVVVACLAFAGLSQWNLKASKRYDFPLMNVIFQRVLRDSKKRDYFVHELAMPSSRALSSRRGKWASSNHRYAFKSPELASFREWLRTEGYRGYQRYLLTHLPATWNEAYAGFRGILRYRGDRQGVRNAATVGTPWIDNFTTRGPLPDHPGTFCLSSALLGGAALLLARSPLVKVLGLLSITLVLGTLSQLYVCFHGDAMEVERHSVVVGILLRLAVLTASVAALSATLSRKPWQAVRRALRPRINAASPAVARRGS